MKKAKAWGGRIEILLSLDIQLSGTIGARSFNDAQALGTRVFVEWEKEKAVPVYNSGTIFSNLKLARKGASLVATSSTTTGIGKFDLTVTFLGIEKTLQANAGVSLDLVTEIEGALEPAVIRLGERELDGVKLSDLELSVAGAISITAEWKEILEKWAAQAGKGLLKDVAGTAAKGAGIEISGEVVLTGSMVVLGVAAIGGAFCELGLAFEFGDLVKSYNPSFAAAMSGFKAGMSGGSEPGSPFGKAGYSQGKANFDKLFARAKRDSPNATDDAIKKAIAGRADDALKEVSDAMGGAVEVAIWDGFLAKHKGGVFPLLQSDAKNGYLSCFGKDPDESSSEWKKYREQHPVASNF
jgi:hypothetical protein